MLPLAAVVLLGELLIPQELRVHALGRNVLRPLRLLDAVPVRLLRVVVRASVLLLQFLRVHQKVENEGGGRRM